MQGHYPQSSQATTEISSLGQLPARGCTTSGLTLGRRARPGPGRQSSPTRSRPPRTAVELEWRVARSVLIRGYDLGSASQAR